MISVIVCSRDIIFFSRFEESLRSTIGVPYQLIKIDNKKGELSIAKAYNLGAKQAQFELLVFAHEDIVFISQDWGGNLKFYFQSLNKTGVLGVAGSNYLPISPSSWWIPDQTRRFCNYLDIYEAGKVGEGKYRFSGHKDPLEVYLLDGMFLAIKKQVFDKIKFDENLEGFHGYDTSLCLRTAIQFQNYFVPDILIKHFSQGKANTAWLLNTVHSYTEKEKIALQFDIDPKLEIKSYHLFLNHLRRFAPNWVFQMQHSLFYASQLNKNINSLKVWALWFYFQIRFFKKSLTNRLKC